MKPVIIQNLIKKMRDRISALPEPTADTEHEPERRDRTGSILLTIFVITIVIMFMLL
jgi:hypothetical protein